jgi:hypothetical protein
MGTGNKAVRVGFCLRDMFYLGLLVMGNTAELRESENRVVRRIFTPKRQDVSGD